MKNYLVHTSHMFRSLLLAGATLFLLTFASCSTTDDSDSTVLGEWYKKSDYEGVGRSGAVIFSIGDLYYVGTGYDGSKWLKDFWVYDAARDTWDQIADFPGVGRSAAVAFTAGGKGYVGTGYDGTNQLKDFYVYDPGTDSWSPIADFEGGARYGALAFEVNGTGYVGTGYDGNYLKDLYAYDVGQNEWVKKVSVGGSKRMNAFAFVINGHAYIGGGKNNGTLVQDFWSYDPETDSWTSLTALDDDDDYSISRELASTFVINGLGYIVGGTESTLSSEVWEYDPALDTWTEKTTFEGSTREAAVGFSYGTSGFIVTGRSGGLRFDDTWMFDPTAEDVD